MSIVKSELEQIYETKARERRLHNLAFAERGVIFVDIDRTYIDERVQIGAGTRVGPGAIITGTTVIGENCVIGQECRVENCTVGDGSEIDHSVMKNSIVGAGSYIGPFAYIRPDSVIGNHCKIGDFVEVKNSVVGDGTKVSHLSYIGDADLGEGVNVGCGVVFANYDGRDKHRSRVGNGVFVGCSVVFVSPVVVDDGAYIAAGTIVTTDVPAGSLRITRPESNTIPNWTERRGLLTERLEKYTRG